MKSLKSGVERESAQSEARTGLFGWWRARIVFESYVGTMSTVLLIDALVPARSTIDYQ
jgi:hypothetical protein